MVFTVELLNYPGAANDKQLPRTPAVIDFSLLVALKLYEENIVGQCLPVFELTKREQSYRDSPNVLRALFSCCLRANW